jgi:uncharacterized membrane protein YraQ (UPF0718 family)
MMEQDPKEKGQEQAEEWGTVQQETKSKTRQQVKGEATWAVVLADVAKEAAEEVPADAASEEDDAENMKQEKKMNDRILDAAKKTKNALIQALPVLGGVLILISIGIATIPREWYATAFTGSLLDPLLGAAAGSVAAGNPITSYVIGGELLSEGVSLIAVTAFLLAWVSVGLVQLPAESALLGKRFALLRNGISFVCAIIIAILTVTTLQVIA